MTDPTMAYVQDVGGSISQDGRHGRRFSCAGLSPTLSSAPLFAAADILPAETPRTLDAITCEGYSTPLIIIGLEAMPDFNLPIVTGFKEFPLPLPVPNVSKAFRFLADLTVWIDRPSAIAAAAAFLYVLPRTVISYDAFSICKYYKERQRVSI